jgi:hypothetical protein
MCFGRFIFPLVPSLTLTWLDAMLDESGSRGTSYPVSQEITVLAAWANHSMEADIRSRRLSERRAALVIITITGPWALNPRLSVNLWLPSSTAGLVIPSESPPITRLWLRIHI